MSGSVSYFKRMGQPIVALASASGGPLAVLRVSGQNLDLLEPIIGPKEKAGTFKVRQLRRLSSDQQELFIDRAVVLFFEAPHSFTGEDVVEIQCHGVSATIEAILNEILAVGALAALPGEFSFRAVANNKMTLSDAEALQGAFASEGLDSFSAARLLGSREAGVEGLNENLEALLEKLAAARGRIEAAIDFPEAEEEQSQDIASALLRIDEVIRAQSSLMTSFENFTKSATLPRVALLGEANAGKSTLLNILSGGKKALVSHVPGTTRDLVEARLRNSRGQWCSILDTAGIRIQKDERKDSHAQIEQAGIELGLDAAKQASLIIWVKNLSERPDPEVEAIIQGLRKRTLIIYSHADEVRTNANIEAAAFDFRNEAQKLRDYLLPQIEKALFEEAGQKVEHETFVSRRQKILIEAAREDLVQAREALKGLRPIELAGELVRSAEQKTRQALGQTLTEEYISQIFSQYCLGK